MYADDIKIYGIYSKDSADQMGWAKTYKIGCGMADCPAGEFFICHYFPRGNIDGEFMYPKGSPGSNCPSGRSRKYKGLCVPPS
ncbi:hypothetical protein ANCDUO_09247 [Ancylostoma duodenale]|uniref:SCP domain-containing protein n=1 Tax=Ancylostoma duodenale TaxID=51022 RepID=A0A0C2GN56_9BILA|nr:hypothetical protein ANCDUO_09247 [Ancylostoma duodenale]